MKGLEYAVLGITPFGEEAVEKAGKLQPDLVLMDIRLKGTIVCERFPLWSELIEQRRAVFVSDTVSLVSAVVPHVPRSVIERVLRLGGWLSDSRAIWLPLIAEDRVIGGLAMWGADLREWGDSVQNHVQ